MFCFNFFNQLHSVLVCLKVCPPWSLNRSDTESKQVGLLESISDIFNICENLQPLVCHMFGKSLSKLFFVVTKFHLDMINLNFMTKCNDLSCFYFFFMLVCCFLKLCNNWKPGLWVKFMYFLQWIILKTLWEKKYINAKYIKSVN